MIKHHRFNGSLEDRVARLESTLKKSTRNRRRFEADGEDPYEIVGLDYTDADREHFEELCDKASDRGNAKFAREQEDEEFDEEYCIILLRTKTTDSGKKALVPAYVCDGGREVEIDEDIVFGTNGCFKWQNRELVKITDKKAISHLAKGVYDISSENADW